MTILVWLFCIDHIFTLSKSPVVFWREGVDCSNHDCLTLVELSSNCMCEINPNFFPIEMVSIY
jgi:hypothetical protein